MNKEELDQALDFINNPDGVLNIVLYTCMSDYDLKLLDVKYDDLPPIKDLFINSIKEHIIEKDDYTVIPLSTADERANCFYQYDLELPAELENLKSVIGNDQISNLSLNDYSFADIDSLIVLISDNSHNLTLYKKITPVEVIGRRGYILCESDSRFERFNKQLLRISNSFQVIQINGEIFILDLKSIEKSFGFHDVIRREATLGVNAIRDKGLVCNIEVLEELIDNVSFARKLTKIAKSSPVLQNNIPNINVINFSKRHPALKNRMRYTPDNTQFMLDTKASKQLFVKLLNDDFLTSELTRTYYDSLAKDFIESEEGNN